MGRVSFDTSFDRSGPGLYSTTQGIPYTSNMGVAAGLYNTTQSVPHERHTHSVVPVEVPVDRVFFREVRFQYGRDW
eukprot:1857443-Rhodomonas_salina.2